MVFGLPAIMLLPARAIALKCCDVRVGGWKRCKGQGASSGGGASLSLSLGGPLTGSTTARSGISQ